MSRFMFVVGLLFFLGVSGSGGCGQSVKRIGVPAEMVEQAQIAGMPRIRYWGDRIDPDLEAEFIRVGRASPPTTNPLDDHGPGIGGLVISGGGDAGTYGAGLLCGWTEMGTRPRPRLVTGVSTGALIAPMAFVGPKYDQLLKESYTKVSAGDVLKKRSFLGMLSADSMADSTPLAKMMEKQFSEEMLADVAREHLKGRRLFVQTVNLDAQRPVIWDMGAIAASGHPDALKLFRQVLLASASIPAVFPPQYIRVEAGGKVYDEMHVDGGTASQMLLSTLPVNLAGVRKEVQVAVRPPLYVIRNGMVRPEWKMIAPKLFPIAGRAIASMIKSQAQTELSLMYYEAKEAQIDFYLTHIPNEYERRSNDEFDTEEMNRMFRAGYDQIKSGEAWLRQPPRLQPLEELKKSADNTLKPARP